MNIYDLLQALTMGINDQIKQYQGKVSLSAQSFSVSELVGTLQEISSITRHTIRSVGELRSFVETMQGKP